MKSTLVYLAKRPAVQLSVLALASLVIYTFALVRPYNLFEWWSKPGVTVAKISNYSPLAGAAFVVSILVLFLLYWFACRLAISFRTKQMWAVVLGGALAFNLVMLALNPVDSIDVFDYVVRARMTAFYGANPFYQYPLDVQSLQTDPFYGYSGWHDVTTAYGPLWELMAARVARVSGNGIIANVLAFKVVAVLSYAITVDLVALALRHYAPNRMLYGVTFLAWNPLVIYSFAGNAHNDATMMLFAVLGLFLMVQGRFTLGAMAETAGGLVKFIPVLIFPVIIVAALKHLNGWVARLWFLVMTSIACGVMIIASYAPFWRPDGKDILGQEWRSHLFTTSLPTLFKVTLQQQWDAKYTDMVVSRGAALVLAAWIAWQLLMLWRTRLTRRGSDWDLYIGSSVAILTFYLLVTCLWFQPWYAAWIVAAGALLPDTLLQRGVVVVAVSSMFKMPMIDFVMQVRAGHVPTVLVREWQGTIGTLILPWIYFVYQSLRGIVQPEYRRAWSPARERGRPAPYPGAGD